MNFFRKLNRQEKRQEGPRDRRRVLRRKFDLASAALEVRTMLTVAFDLAYGAPGANLYGAAGFHDGGGALSARTPVYVIFWGSYFTQADTKTSEGTTAYNTDLNLAEQELNSQFFSALSQYKGSPGKLYLAGFYQDTTDSLPSNKQMTTSVVHGEVQNVINNKSSGIPPPSSNWPIYVVVTAPTYTLPNYLGYNQNSTSRTDIWVSTKEPASGAGAAADNFSQVFSHEVAEADSDPVQNPGLTITTSLGVELAPGPNVPQGVQNPAQVADNEGQFHLYRPVPGGPIYNSYWSQSAGKFVVPDGNSEIFDVSGGTLAINKEQVGATLTVDGGQAGSIDNFELVQNANGSIDVTLDSQTVYFDPGVIAKIVVNTESSLTLVSLEGTWNGSTSVVVNVDAQSPVDIFAAPDSKDIAANFSNMSVQVNDPRDESNLFFESTSSAYEENWGISSGNYSVSGNLGNNNLNIDYSFGHAASVNVDAGTIENDVDIENATCPINVALGGAANFVQLSLGQQNLGYEFTSPISITGQIETLQFYDQSDIAPRTVNIDDGEFYLAGEPVVHFQAVDAITYYAGWGPDVINVAPGSENLSDVAPIVWVHGANNRSDTLNVFDNDSSSAAGNQYTVSASGSQGIITRTFGQPASSESQTIDYMDLDGAVTLDTDNHGTPLDIEATAPSEPLNVNLGTASTVVSIADQSQTLANLGSPVTLNGGGGANSLVLYDQKDSTASTLPYMLQSTTISRPSSATAYGPSVTFHNFSSGVTLDTDNHGTPVDIEGMSAPTTVNVGSANTSVTVAQNGQSLASFITTASGQWPLKLNGGSGADSLIVYDTKNPSASAQDSYTVNAGSIVRSDPITILNIQLVLSTTINYSGFSSVTLNTDNNGTPVDVEGTSVPTTINIGSGNTTVSIASQSQTLANLKASLVLQGGVGSNTLNVFDRNDAIKSTLPYVLQAGALERPVSATTYGPWITYKWFPKGITLQTDNNGTPVDVEGVSTPTNVDLGSGNTAVTVAQNVKSLSPFVTSVYVQSPLMINGGSGSDSLTVNDQNTKYVAGQSGSYTVSANSIWLVVPDGADNLPRLAQINYQSMLGGVTLNTDNNGTPVDVEGISAPTTVNIGSGNTKVTDSATGESLAGMTTSANFEYLTLNGGSGSDSLIVNDTKNTISSTQDSYTVNAGSIVRSDPETFLNLHLVLTASVYYAGFSSVALNTDNNGTRVDVEGTSAPTTINIGSGNTVVDVTTNGQNLGQLGSDLTVNGGIGLDSLVVNDSANPLAPSTTRLGTTVTARTYSYGVTSSDISRSATSITTSLSIRGTLVRTSISTLNINYASIRGGVTLDTDNNSTPVMVSGAPGTAPVTIGAGTGTNSIYGPAVANTWSLTGTNTGVLDNWVHLSGFANLYGGTLSDSFDFTSSSLVTGNITSVGGNDLLNYAADSSSVTVNLATGAASGVRGSIQGIQGVVGGSGTNSLTGSGRCLLIGGAGPAQLFGGSSDSLLIAGTTSYDMTDAALESILDEWDRTDLGFSQRMQHLTSGGGLNGSDILVSSTVNGNGKADTITSKAGQAWIFASKYDKVVSQKSSDVVTPLSN